MKVEVKPEPKKAPQIEITLEDAIVQAANDWAARFTAPGSIQTLQRHLRDALTSAVYSRLGLIRDTWNEGHWRVDSVTNKVLPQMVQQAANVAIEKLLETIEFEPVVLTAAQITAIQKAYHTALREHAVEAARQLAEHDAFELARSVLGIGEETEENNGD